MNIFAISVRREDASLHCQRYGQTVVTAVLN